MFFIGDIRVTCWLYVLNPSVLIQCHNLSFFVFPDFFVNNVFTQLVTEAVKVSQNQTISRIIEELLYLAKPHNILALLEVFVQDLETVCTDRFASYVMQTSVLLSSQYFTDKETGEKLLDIFETVYKFFNSQLPIYMQDTYASHIVRVIIEILGGVKVDQRIIRSRMSQSSDKGKYNVKCRLCHSHLQRSSFTHLTFCGFFVCVCVVCVSPGCVCTYVCVIFRPTNKWDRIVE